jgi:hypothetical protein
VASMKKWFAGFLDGLKRDGFAATAKRWVRRVQLVIAWLSVIVFVVWSITPWRKALTERKIFDEGTILGILGILVVLMLTSLDELFKHTKSLVETFAGRTPARGLIHGVGEIYPQLRREMQEATASERGLDVLGLTLFTAWPTLESWLEQKDGIRDWRINLYCLSPEFARQQRLGIPADWAALAESFLAKAKSYATTRSVDLAYKGIAIELFEYRAFPAIHGFRLNNGTLFVSAVRWDLSTGELAQPNHPYELFPATDTSDRAEAFRSLFGNWLDHARDTAAPVRASAQ